MRYNPFYRFPRRIPHARQRYPARCDVQLSLAGATGSGGPPLATHSPDGGYGVETSFAAFRGHVCRGWTPVDSSREAPARPAAAVPLFGAQRAFVDGAVG